MSEKALKIMHPFLIRYMYEPAFSTLEIIKKDQQLDISKVHYTYVCQRY